MGRKDATASHSTPVDQYRKQIGKQDWKKSKKEMKLAKQIADKKKSAMGIKDITLVLVAFLLLIACVYLFLYWYLEKDKLGTVQDSEKLKN